MATTKININGISELDFTNGIASVSNTNDVTTITLAALGVTSVAFTAPTEFNVSGSPITSSGTIALTWKTEIANVVFAGPSSGAASVPTFRALVAADIPALPYVTGTGLTAGQLIIGAGSSAIAVGNLSGDVTTSGSAAASVIKLRGAALDATIGTAGAGQDGFVIYWDNSSTSYKLKAIVAGVSSLTGDGSVYINSLSTGAVTLTLGTQTANRVFAGPTTGSPATPTFRALVAADIPSLSATYQLLSQKDTASGYAGLDAGTMLQLAEMKLGRNAQTGTSYSIADSDRAKVITISNASAIAVALPQAGASSLFIDGWWCWIKNISTGVATVTPTTSKIEGAGLMVMPPGSSALLFSNGTDYLVLNHGSISGASTSSAPSYFCTQGNQFMTVIGSGTTPITNGGDVYGWMMILPQAMVIRNMVAKISVGVAAGTIAFGMSDVNGGKIFSSGSQVATTANTQYAITLSTPCLLLPGSYRTCWTASSTTITFYPSGAWNIGSSWTNPFNLNSIKFFKASTGASAGDIPASLGSFTTSTLALTTAIPAIFYEG